MKDFAIDKGLVKEIETSARKFGYGKGFFGFRKMFWDYLNKLHVPFLDLCCPEASTNPTIEPIGFDTALGEIVRFDGTSWVPITAFTTSTTTTTTVAPTTSTTTTTTL